MSQPGLEAVSFRDESRSDNDGLEVVETPLQELYEKGPNSPSVIGSQTGRLDPNQSLYTTSIQDSQPATPIKFYDERPRMQTRRRRLLRWSSTLVAVLIIAIVAIVPAVVVTQKRKNGSTGSAINSNLTKQYLSGSGALNGTGIATLFPNNTVDDLWLVYQSYTGDIVYSAYSSGGAWQSGQSLGIHDAFNGTSLAAVTYNPVGSDGTAVNVFYYDTSGTLQGRVKNAHVNSWAVTNLGSYNFKTVLKPGIALAAQYNFNQGLNQQGGGMSLWASTETGHVQEYTYDQQSNAWTIGDILPGTNGYGGMDVRSIGTLTVLHLLDTNNKLQSWWRDWTVGNNSHPPGSWNQGPSDTIPVHGNSSTSTCSTPFESYYQNDNLTISALGFKGVAAEQRWNATASTISDTPVLQNTAIKCAVYSTSSHSNAFTHLFFQPNGSSIVEYGNPNNGNWVSLYDIPLN